MFDMDELFSTIEQTAMKLVLVVEADAEIGPLLVQAIKEETPYQAFLVTNGVQALQISREVTPNLFLLDYRLPGMDGFELYKLLHTMEELEYVHAILMSASSFFLDATTSNTRSQTCRKHSNWTVCYISFGSY